MMEILQSPPAGQESVLTCDTPLGPIVLRAAQGAIVACEFATPAGPLERYGKKAFLPGSGGLPPTTFQTDGAPADQRHSKAVRMDDLFEREKHALEDSQGLLIRAARQLSEYFYGDRANFDLPLRPTGTPFQQRVWKALLSIPYGRTTTYSDLARQLGQPGASRAVGSANGRNPISIFIPCHRVIGSGGKLAGYSSGVARKQWLLELEQRQAA